MSHTYDKNDKKFDTNALFQSTQIETNDITQNGLQQIPIKRRHNIFYLFYSFKSRAICFNPVQRIWTKSQ